MTNVKKLFFAGFLFILAGCSSEPPKEISRITSPDGKVDAVIAIEEDAFSKIQTSVHIVPKGKNISEYRQEFGIPTFVAYKTENLSISWEEPQKLVISFSSARVFAFTNYWETREFDDRKKYTLHIYLKDQTAP